MSQVSSVICSFLIIYSFFNSKLVTHQHRCKLVSMFSQESLDQVTISILCILELFHAVTVYLDSSFQLFFPFKVLILGW